MQHFKWLRRAFIFLALVFVVLMAYNGKLHLQAHNRYAQLSGYSHIDNLILGDSHAASNFAPHFINSSVNIAQNSEDIFYSYYKLTKMFSSKNNFKRVFFALSYHSLCQYRDDTGAIREMMKRYHLVVDKEFYKNKHRIDGFNHILFLQFITDFYLPIGIANDIVEYFLIDKRIYAYIGGYYPYYNSVISSKSLPKVRVNYQFVKDNKLRSISQMNILYLQKIKIFCEQNDVKLYLINTPIYPKYYNEIPPIYISTVDKLGYQMQNTNTSYINLSSMNLPDSSFYDYDHLNSNGSEIFSCYINNIILKK